MPDDLNQSAQSLPPPSGDPHQAEKYITRLISLIDQNKVEVTKTDLSKFDPSALEDHYQTQLEDYSVEVSHSKHPQTGKDSYIILFTSVKHISNSHSDKVILAYLYLEETQFTRFRKAALDQLDRQKKSEEEKRLKIALEPVDQALDQLREP